MKTSLQAELSPEPRVLVQEAGTLKIFESPAENEQKMAAYKLQGLWGETGEQVKGHVTGTGGGLWGHLVDGGRITCRGLNTNVHFDGWSIPLCTSYMLNKVKWILKHHYQWRSGCRKCPWASPYKNCLSPPGLTTGGKPDTHSHSLDVVFER